MITSSNGVTMQAYLFLPLHIASTNVPGRNVYLFEVLPNY